MSNYSDAYLSRESDNPKYDYVGDVNEAGLRSNYGLQKWGDNIQHKYAGYFLYNNLHGKGFYFIQKEHYNTLYDGQFYNNELEGYGQVIQKDGNIFEGLFKKNRRFGPGILTYPDGKQDVGLWNGLSLMRLSVSMSGDTVPSLGKTVLGKTKLLRYKKIVPACETYQEPAKTILEDLKAPPEVLNRYMRLYNPNVRNSNSLFFDRRYYDLFHFGSEDCYIEVVNRSGSTMLNINVNTGESEDRCECTNERCVQLSNQIDEIQSKLKSINEMIRFYESQLNPCGKCSNINIPTKNTVRTKDSNSVELENTDTSYVELGHEESNAGEMTCLCHNKSGEVDTMEFELGKLKSDELFYQTALDFLNRKYHQEITSINYVNVRPQTTKVVVKHLLSWNNEQSAIEILQHCFRYRNFEDNINFNVKTLLIGDREKLGSPGVMEKNCYKFLKLCENGRCLEASRMLLEHNLNPDLCDGRGNAGIHLGTAIDNCTIIQLLTNYGANLDITNDECLTPLLICLLKYLAYMHHVVNWETAFLSDITLDEKERAEVNQWRPHESLVNLRDTRYYSSSDKSVPNSRSQSLSDDISLCTQTVSNSGFNVQNTAGDYFLLSIEYLQKGVVKIPKSPTSKAGKPGTRQTIDDRLKKTDETPTIATELVVILKTIDTLLDSGANPNRGETPLPPVLLSIFTKNCKLVENILKHKGNPNTMLDGNLSPLHILVSLKSCSEYVDICKIFLSYSSDPNIKSNVNHWAQENNAIIGAYPNCSSSPVGKTALQMLCMREDFRGEDQAYFCGMASALLEHGAISDSLFLGHTSLSLAVLRGNVDLVKTLFDYVDYNKPLGENMGNALTVLALTRYPYVIPFHECKSVLDQLVGSGMSPFDEIYNFSNVFEFLQYEAPPIKNVNKPKVQAKMAARLRRFRKVINSKKMKLITTKCNLISKEYLMQRGRQILMTRYMFQALIYLLQFVELNFLRDVCVKNLAKFFTVNETLGYLKMLFQSGTVPMESFSKKSAVILVKFVKRMTAIKKKKKEKKPKPKSSKISKKSSKKSQTVVKIEDLVDKMDFESPLPAEYASYIFDQNTRRYDVCFYCLEKTNKLLLRCPCCGIVSFCSDRCNQYANKLPGSKHKCQFLFYNRMKRLYELALAKETPFPNRIELMLLEAKQLRTIEAARASALEQQQSEKSTKELTDIPKIRHASVPVVERLYYLEKIEEDDTITDDMVNVITCSEPDMIETELQRPSCGFRIKSKLISRTSGISCNRSSSHITPKLSIKLSERLSLRKSKTSLVEFTDDKMQALEEDIYLAIEQEITSKSSKYDKPSSSKENEKRDPSGKDSPHHEAIDKRKDRISKGVKSTKTQTAKYGKKGGTGKKKPGGSKNSLQIGGRTKSGSKKELNSVSNLAKFNLLIPRGGYKGKIKNVEEEVLQLSKLYQYFLQLLAKYFPDFEIGSLLFPFAVFNEGQLYYKFAELSPIYGRIYSVVS